MNESVKTQALGTLSTIVELMESDEFDKFIKASATTAARFYKHLIDEESMSVDVAKEMTAAYCTNLSQVSPR